MFNKTRLSTAVAAAFGLSTIALLPNVATAQEEALIEEVIVTGSRIVRDGYSSSSPVAVYDEEDIGLAGNASLDEFFRNVPQFTGFQLGASTNNGSDGDRNIDMRGLGFNRTLILINGRRQIGDVQDDGAVDINTIPQAMLKRVDVLTDGASTVYGSDAIAGVVNFVLNDDFEGIRFNANYGAGTDEWDAQDTSISVLMGAGNDRGHFVFSAGYYDQEEMLQADRSWAENELFPILGADGNFTLEPSGSSNSRRIRVPDQGNWIFDEGLGAARPFEAGDVYNFAPVNALVQPVERYQFGTIGRYSLTDSIEFFTEAFYTRRTSQQRLAPDASFAVTSTFDTPNNGSQWNDFVPANNPFNPFGSVNCSNPLGLCDIDVRINRRFEESGGRIFRQTSDNYRLLGGIRGELENGIRWDVAYTYAETETINETLNLGRFDRWAIAVDPDACAADAACTAAGGTLNPFGDFGSISPEQMDFLTTGSLKDNIGAELEMFTVNVSGEAFAMSGGDVAWALGYERRQEQGFFSPDEFIAGGLTTGGASDPLRGSFEVDEFYGEVLLPVLDNLTVEASARYSDYDTVGDETTFKIGGDWEIVDGLRVRSTYSTGFRAPNIAELNQQDSADFPQVANPCDFGDRALAAGDISQTVFDNCQAAGFDTSDAGGLTFAWQSLYETSSTGDLAPEQSTTYTIGVVYEPSWAEGLRLSVDYWDIEIEDAIGEPDFNVLFNACLADPSSPACATFDASATNGIITGGFPGDAVAQFGNLGTINTSGVDFAAVYNGTFNSDVVTGYKLSVNGTFLDVYEEDFQLGGTLDLAGTAEGFDVYPEWRTNFSAGIYGQDWTLDWFIRYISESDALWRSPATTADAVAEEITYHDLVGTYTYKSLRINVGVNNITDEEPPIFTGAFNANTAPGMYDVIGRRLFTSLTYEF
ncbi:MAG: TonB-dependent receptor [Pseudomonadota bacterium]